MVRIASPPPINTPDPLFHILPAGTHLVRLFDPTRHNATAVSFRYFGPLLRFDHQRFNPDTGPQIDTMRGIYYAGFSLSCCLVEVFGDTGIVNTGSWHAGMPLLTRDIRLLDLRNHGAMRAGSVAAIAKVPDHRLSQEWSRYFYAEAPYMQPDGVLWYNAHNDEEACALYERASDAIVCPAERIVRLDDPLLRPTLLGIARTNNLVVMP